MTIKNDHDLLKTESAASVVVFVRELAQAIVHAYAATSAVSKVDITSLEVHLRVAESNVWVTVDLGMLEEQEAPEVRAFFAQVGADVVDIPVNTAVKVTESPSSPAVSTGCVITPVED